MKACYRGPRLYDTDETRTMVKAQVDRFKTNRAILESDIDHGASRRPDGRSFDWILHVNPDLETPGMLVVHNPLDNLGGRRIQLDPSYRGLRGPGPFYQSEPPATPLLVDLGVRRFL